MALHLDPAGGLQIPASARPQPQPLEPPLVRTSIVQVGASRLWTYFTLRFGFGFGSVLLGKTWVLVRSVFVGFVFLTISRYMVYGFLWLPDQFRRDLKTHLFV